MGTVSYSFVLAGSATIVGLILTPLAILVARTIGLFDKPNVRKVHKMPVPRIGGVAIVLATVLPLIVFGVLRRAELGLADLQPVLALLIGAVSLAIVGLLDDVFEVSSKYKLLALLAASVAFCAAGGAVKSLTLSGHDYLHLGLASWPLTMLWIALVTVSMNFIDGLDGLAGGIGLITCGVLAVCAAVGGDGQSVLVAAALAGAIAAFLVYNSHPARVFMGDCGSMFIGFTLAGACALASTKVGTSRGLLLPGLALSVPLLDTLLTMVRRGVLQRRSLFAAERGHVHHRLLDTGLAHHHVVWILYLVTLGGALVALVCLYSGWIASTTAMIAFVLCLGGLFRTAGSVRARETLAAARRNRALGREAKRYQNAFYDLQLRFREVSDFDAWWATVCRAGEVLDFAKIDLPVVRRDGTSTVLRWRRDAELIADSGSITAEVPIPQRRADINLRASIEVLVADFLESGGQRVALFSRLMGEFGLNQIKYKGIRSDGKTPAADAASAGAAASPAPAVDPGPLPGLRVAIVHDFLYTYAGAERVLEQMLQVFPQAELFSLFDFLPAGQRGFLGDRAVQSSFLQRLPMAKRRHRAYLPLMPLAIEQLDVSQYELVLSSSYVAAKGVITRPDQLHVCYCHTPVRFAWDLQNQYLGQVGLKRGLRSLAAKMILHYIRTWDVRSANGVDRFLTNSNFVSRRIQKVYRRESTTIYPPVDTDFFALCETKEDYYVTASRMVPYKRIDLIVEAFTAMPGRRLIVVGEGPEWERIKAKAGPNVTMVGHQTAEGLRQYMQNAKAFVFAAEEDFGIAPVEALACGTPVIAFGRGGVTETVVDGRTGVFFDRQDVASITDAVERFESTVWDAAAISRHAENFSAARFRDKLGDEIGRAWAEFCDARVAGENVCVDRFDRREQARPERPRLEASILVGRAGRDVPVTR